MIKLSNGHILDYVVASGALGFDGEGWPWEQPLKWIDLLDPSLFTIAIKTLTYNNEVGNLRWWKPWSCIRFYDNGAINAVKLTNPGIKKWSKKFGQTVNRSRNKLIGSISIGNDEAIEVIEMVGILNDFNFVGLEINVSCPNIKSRVDSIKNIITICNTIVEASHFPIILKLSPVLKTKDIKKILFGVEKVEAISINSVPWDAIFPNIKSPLAHLGGGAVSGKMAQPLTWDAVKKIKKVSRIPVIGPSIWDFEDMEKVRAHGASAVSFGSIFLPYPWRPTLFVRKEKKIEHTTARF